MSRMIAIADDLSGAAETAAALSGPAGGQGALRRDSVVLCWPGAVIDSEHSIIVFDTDTRVGGARSAAASLRRALAAAGNGVPLFKKIDSQLRGNTEAELVELAASHRLAVACALPALGRTVVGGNLQLSNGRVVAVRSVVGQPTSIVELHTVHQGVNAVVEAVRDALARDTVPILDSQSDADLDIIASALLSVDGVALVGSGGLAAAVGRTRSSVAGRTAPARVVSGVHPPITVVVGTTETSVGHQLEFLKQQGIPVVRSTKPESTGRLEVLTAS